MFIMYCILPDAYSVLEGYTVSSANFLQQCSVYMGLTDKMTSALLNGQNEDWSSHVLTEGMIKLYSTRQEMTYKKLLSEYQVTGSIWDLKTSKCYTLDSNVQCDFV
jgi:hypothetical protein